MRKRLIAGGPRERLTPDENWLNLERLAEVEITSEDAAHPIEAALLPGSKSGWRAAESGEQVIRLLFGKPHRISRIHLRFLEDRHERTHEFVLRWSADNGRSYREIVRQQYNFSPPGTTREVEDYTVDLEGVTALELSIVPSIGAEGPRASLEQLRLA